MGYTCHHAIIVTTFLECYINEAHEQAQRIFPEVSKIFLSEHNGWYTFFIPPDGSKEGWPDSHLGDQRRQTFMDWCDSQREIDDSNAITATEIRYYDDNGQEKIERITWT